MEYYLIKLFIIGNLVCANALTSEATSTRSQPDVTLEDYDTTFLPNRSVCGTFKETTRIYGGKAAGFGEFPWVVALEYKSKSTNNISGVKCIGTLINQRYVLTGATCVNNPAITIVNAILGDWKLDTDPDCIHGDCAPPAQKIPIQDTIKHDNYRPLENDIALLRLSKEAVYNEFVSPVCLPPKNLPFPQLGHYITVAGWGKTENGALSTTLLKVELPIVSREVCGKKLNKVITDNRFCAGGEAGKDSCLGDSGSAGISVYGDGKNDPRWYQYGIVSAGAGCGVAGYAGIYTSVSKYMDWIITNIEKNNALYVKS